MSKSGELTDSESITVGGKNLLDGDVTDDNVGLLLDESDEIRLDNCK